MRRPAATALLLLLIAASPASDGRRSGYDFAGPEVRAMQDDDSANPGMLWVSQGEFLWNLKAGPAERSCADCHGDARAGMKGVAARHPAFDAILGRPIDLEQRINRCRTERQQVAPLAWESEDLLALTAFVAFQSRGMPVTVTGEGPLRPALELGDRLFHQREGQLNLACSQCHDDNWGKRLAGNVIPQAHPTGYPIYRLEWQSVGSLQRRLRNCMTGVRAEPFDMMALQLTPLITLLDGAGARHADGRPRVFLMALLAWRDTVELGRQRRVAPPRPRQSLRPFPAGPSAGQRVCLRQARTHGTNPGHGYSAAVEDIPSSPTSRITSELLRGRRASSLSSRSWLDAVDRDGTIQRGRTAHVDCRLICIARRTDVDVMIVHDREEPSADVGFGLPEMGLDIARSSVSCTRLSARSALQLSARAYRRSLEFLLDKTIEFGQSLSFTHSPSRGLQVRSVLVYQRYSGIR